MADALKDDRSSEKDRKCTYSQVTWFWFGALKSCGWSRACEASYEPEWSSCLVASAGQDSELLSPSWGLVSVPLLHLGEAQGQARISVSKHAKTWRMLRQVGLKKIKLKLHAGTDIRV